MVCTDGKVSEKGVKRGAWVLQLREAAVAAMIRAQQEKAKPQAQPPSLEERASGKPAGSSSLHCSDAQALARLLHNTNKWLSALDQHLGF